MARLVSWLIDATYLALLALVFPILLYRAMAQGKYRAGWRERLLGDIPPRAGRGTAVWFHAVSVGEVLQLQPLLQDLGLRRPDVDVVISTTTRTGREVALKKYPRHQVIWFPLDFSWAVRRAISRIRPSLIVLVELELWPNFLREAAASHVPVALINGRISQRSFRGYRWLRPLLRPLLESLALAAVQDETYARLLRQLGRSSPTHVTGSIKFDGVETDPGNDRTRELRRAFSVADGEQVFIAGSTQDPEERFALEAWRALREKHPRLRLMLVPRHKERFEAVARMVVREFGLPLLRRSVPSVLREGEDGPPVLLLDTLGELSFAWGLADVAFVGGSLTTRGGQNMLEPAGYGAAVLFGPNTHNFRDIVSLLQEADAARVVRTPEQLTATVDTLLSNPAAARALGQRARSLVQTHRGASQRTVQLLLPLIPPPSLRRAA